MRNWNIIPCFTWILIIELRAYLWGIETDCLWRYWKCYINCEPTYEELKPLFACPIDYRAHIIASLPMRNWNSKSANSSSSQILNCEPTYEELKLTSLLFTSAKSLAQLRAYLWGIETDFSPVMLFGCAGIASLPMRNWNPNKKSINHLKKYPIASLPMRNWNQIM